jgi:hypothetical protein
MTVNKQDQLVESVFNSLKEKVSKAGLNNFRKWLERVIEFTLEDEPTYKPNLSQIKELWEFGAPAGGASSDCIALFRSNK